MGITGIQLAQNCFDHPGIGINGISVTEEPLHNVWCLISMCALSDC